MISASSIRGGSKTRRNLRQVCRTSGWFLMGAILFLVSGRLSYGQTTAQLTGTVQDVSGAVIPGAQVTLTDEATGASRVIQSNGQGFYAFPALVPDSYSVKVTASGFQAKEVKKITVHAGDSLTIPPISLAPGAASATVTVEATGDMIPTDNGARISVLDSKQIETLALMGRDTTELLKVLPGATTHVREPDAEQSCLQRSQHGRAAERDRQRHQYQRCSESRRHGVAFGWSERH